MPKIKTRFAPSPTGYLHIGGLRTALYNYLFAKQNKGKFVLRIEDTDQERYVPGSEKRLIETLQKIGLEWDEGPVMTKTLSITEKGQNKPYFQSKRLRTYELYVKNLLNNKNAYYCACSKERLEKLRKDQIEKNLPPKYDGLCREKDLRPKTNDQYVVRLRVPEEGSIKFNDLIRGDIEVNCNDIDDQVLIKSDSFPTYHLANVVDDYLMNITHVIRGEEWLPSTPKHILLYQAFGWDLPIFAHLPLLLNPDKSKLSKRESDVSVEDFLNKGYLPEALINYVALMGWHPKDDKEIFNIKDLIREFDLKRVQKGGAIFDTEKLKWFNCYYIRQKSNKELIKLCQKFLPDVDKKILNKVLEIEKERLETVSQIKELIESTTKLTDYSSKLLIFKKSNKEKTLKGLQTSLEILSEVKKWNRRVIKKKLEQAVKDNNLKNGDVFWPVRAALSGKEKSPPPEEIMEIIGKRESLARIKKAIEKLS